MDATYPPKGPLVRMRSLRTNGETVPAMSGDVVNVRPRSFDPGPLHCPLRGVP